MIITCLMTQYKINITGVAHEDAVETFYNNLNAIPTFAVFYTARWFFSRRSIPAAVERVIIYLGSCAFGIMLCEEVVIIKGIAIFKSNFMEPCSSFAFIFKVLVIFIF